MELNFIPVFAFGALLVKLIILSIVGITRSDNIIFVAVISVFAIHNLCEVLAYTQFLNGSTAEWLLRSYYVVSIWAQATICLYAIEVARPMYSKPTTVGILAFTSIVSILMLSTNYVIQGTQSIGYALTIIKGPAYFLFQFIVLVTAVFTIYTLMSGKKRLKGFSEKQRCTVTLIAFVPVMAVSVLVVAAMILKIDFNAAGIAPICTTLFLYIIFKGEKSIKLYDLRISVPKSAESETANKLLLAFSGYSSESNSHKQTMDDIERHLIQYKQSVVDEGNITQLAGAIKMPRTSVYNMLERLGIKENPN